jgi:hypothetical protein
MSTFRPASRAGALLIPFALVVAACGASAGSSSPGVAAPSNETSDTSAPTAAPSTGGVLPSGLLPSGLAIPSFDISEITKGLANLDSYRVSISVGGEEVYKGTVVTKPVLARDITVKGGTRIVVIGSDAWVAQNGGPVTKVPEVLATGMFAAFDPSRRCVLGSGVGPELPRPGRRAEERRQRASLPHRFEHRRWRSDRPPGGRLGRRLALRGGLPRGIRGEGRAGRRHLDPGDRRGRPCQQGRDAELTREAHRPSAR